MHRRRRSRRRQGCASGLYEGSGTRPEGPGATVYRARAFALLKDYKSAFESFDKTLTIRSEFPEVHYQLGQIFADREDWLVALNEYTKAIQMKPGYPDAYKGRALVKLTLGDKIGFGEDDSVASRRTP